MSVKKNDYIFETKNQIKIRLTLLKCNCYICNFADFSFFYTPSSPSCKKDDVPLIMFLVNLPFPV